MEHVFGRHGVRAPALIGPNKLDHMIAYELQRVNRRRNRTDGVGVLRELNSILRASGIAPLRSNSLPVCGKAEFGDVSPRIGRVLVFVEDHFHQPLTIDDLAGEAGLSKYHFSRVFREEVGETPWAFVRRTRIERAKDLLERGASPAAAAVDAGFFDQSHLTNVLREVEGTTPKQYRDAHRRRKDFQE